MVFSSIPAYLDTSNWQQQQNNQIIGSSGENPLLQPPPQPGPPPHGAGGAGSIRPGSMAERARLANIPLPEAALKCPRCESTNTKFCYFNNYSLSQPRHFCKTCRRYWTRGGALRNVPVGGGCRRNKRSKSTTSSKSPASSDRQTNSTSATNISSTNSAMAAANMLGLSPQLQPLRFVSPLSQITDNFNTDLINYSGITAPSVGTADMNFHGSSNLIPGSAGAAGGVASLLSSGGGTMEPWRLHHQIQQFSSLGGLDPSPPGLFHAFHQGGESGFMNSEASHHVRPKLSSSMLSHLTTSVKMEENPEQLNLSRQLLGSSSGRPAGNEQWNATSAPWNELPNFNTSSRSNQM